MPYINCVNCGTTFQLADQTYQNYKGNVKCPGCKALLYIHTSYVGSLYETPKLISLPEDKKTDRIISEQISLSNAPEPIQDDINEAFVCLSNGAFKACVIMCRRTLEQLCNTLNANGNTLYEKIQFLNTNGYLSDRETELFNEIRFFGNYGAHPNNDLLGDVSQNDASLVYEITIHVIRLVFEIPDKIIKLQTRRSKP